MISQKNKIAYFKLSLRKYNPFYSKIISNEIAKILCYFKNIYQYSPCIFDKITILNFLDFKNKHIINKSKIIEIEENSIIFLNGNFNHTLDIQQDLEQIYSMSKRCSRVAVVLYNPYIEIIYKLSKYLKIYKGDIPNNFVTKVNLLNLLKLSKFEVVSFKNLIYIPFYLFGLEKIINKLCSHLPIIKHFSFVSIVYLRPIKKSSPLSKLSIVVPARNESGNIQNIFREIKDLSNKIPLQLIMVEGNSTDSTWEEIQKILPQYKDSMDIKILQQVGRGKADAVRIGFQHANGDLFTILDADLTVSSVHLEKFYSAYLNGLGDFINGNRLVYPMEKGAMKFLNRIGNIFFAKALSYILDIKIGDSLCGTKMFSKTDYERFQIWRKKFGDFDPFGDFELIFPASELKLGVVDLPIHYKNRAYGETNIQRFRDGFRLLKMAGIGFFKIKL